MFTRMKKVKTKGPSLKDFGLQKGQLGSVLNESWISKRTDPIVSRSDPNRNILKGLSLKVLSSKRTDPAEFIEFMVFFPAFKTLPRSIKSTQTPYLPILAVSRPDC